MRWQMMKTMANNENDIKELQEKERIEDTNAKRFFRCSKTKAFKLC